MPRGGARPGAGGKPTWKNGKTKTIRVPVALADAILAFARDLDEHGIIEPDTVSKTIDVSQLIVPEIRGRRFVFLSDLVKVGYEIYPSKWDEVARAELRATAKNGGNKSKPMRIHI
jgi:hypothetical protein